MPQLPPVTHPQHLEDFILKHGRVQAIAHQKYFTTVNRLLQHPLIQGWLCDRLQAERVRRCELEAEDWQALAEYLQRKSTKEQILNPQPCPDSDCLKTAS